MAPFTRDSFFSDESKDAFVRAIQHVESRSAAEVVIAARGRTGNYLHADLIAAILAGLATLVFLLFSPWPHPLAFFVIEPLVIGFVIGFLASRSPSWRRWCTPESVRRQRVRDAARSAFVERGVHRTSGRTGILVFISELERMAEVVCDVGVEEAVPEPLWIEAVDAIDDALYDGEAGPAVAQHVEKLAELLEEALPRSEDDVNELGDEVHA